MDDFPSLCRLCLNRTPQDVADDEIYQKIGVCIGLVINPMNKALPWRVCSESVEKVEVFHRYRESCWDTHNMLLNMLNEAKLVDNEGCPEEEGSQKEDAASETESNAEGVLEHEEEAKSGGSTHNEDSEDVVEADTKKRKREKPIIMCEKCGKMLRPTFYPGHLNEHNGIKPFACEHYGCSKTFACRHSLRQHTYYRHSGQMFHCQECGKAYKSKMELSTHRLHVHTRGKAFPCEQCGLSFVTRSYLKTHMKEHYKVFREQCSYCAKMLFSEKGLKYHELQHTGERPFQCSMCSKKFRSRRLLVLHKKGECKTERDAERESGK
uniref:Protein krueppel n=1 Tax=Anopheles epiroticus TaxID=199890 RepID=A0A182P6F6_9DIPT